MEKLSLYVYTLLCIVMSSCMGNNSNINISYSETGHHYSMNADFGKDKTLEVEKYMDDKIGAASNLSFTNTQSDATLTLDDRTTFYMKKYPGHVEIKLDKDENSQEAYLKIKSMCEGLKKILVK